MSDLQSRDCRCSHNRDSRQLFVSRLECLTERCVAERCCVGSEFLSVFSIKVLCSVEMLRCLLVSVSVFSIKVMCSVQMVHCLLVSVSAFSD